MAQPTAGRRISAGFVTPLRRIVFEDVVRGIARHQRQAGHGVSATASRTLAPASSTLLSPIRLSPRLPTIDEQPEPVIAAEAIRNRGFSRPEYEPVESRLDCPRVRTEEALPGGMWATIHLWCEVRAGW